MLKSEVGLLILACDVELPLQVLGKIPLHIELKEKSMWLVVHSPQRNDIHVLILLPLLIVMPDGIEALRGKHQGVR